MLTLIGTKRAPAIRKCVSRKQSAAGLVSMQYIAPDGNVLVIFGPCANAWNLRYSHSTLRMQNILETRHALKSNARHSLFGRELLVALRRPLVAVPAFGPVVFEQWGGAGCRRGALGRRLPPSRHCWQSGQSKTDWQSQSKCTDFGCRGCREPGRRWAVADQIRLKKMRKEEGRGEEGGGGGISKCNWDENSSRSYSFEAHGSCSPGVYGLYGTLDIFFLCTIL